MAYDYSELSQRVDLWAQQSYQLGWISEISPTSFTQQDKKPLFENTTHSLIVAFMGGTGVGKSSLLNRLAGKPIAKSGVARPTSKEVTLFHHRDVVLQNLPLTDIRVANHDDNEQKNIVWIDMPDFDSTDTHNKELVLSWLPHINVLIYVVSPERYRDEKAWRLLLAEGASHGWLFVMNQWDRGQIEQLVDFEKQLHVAGFDEPLIFKTCCAESIENDEFSLLSETLVSLATQKTITQLEQRGEQVRVQMLQNQLQNYLTQLGDETALKKLQHLWQKNWKTTELQLQQSFEWRLKPLAAHFANLSPIEKNSIGDFWEDLAQTYFEDALNMLIIDAQNLHLPTAPLEMQFSKFREKIQKQVNSNVELQTRQALAQRGNIVQRAFLTLMAIAEIALPLAAMGWVSFEVVNGYYENNQTHDHYLNLDFAIHSTLLCGLSWLVPFFILKKCQPSLEKCALRGLNKGISQSLENLNQEVNEAIEQFKNQHATQLQNINALLVLCELITKTPVEIDKNSDLSRMMSR